MGSGAITSRGIGPCCSDTVQYQGANRVTPPAGLIHVNLAIPGAPSRFASFGWDHRSLSHAIGYQTAAREYPQAFPAVLYNYVSSYQSIRDMTGYCSTVHHHDHRFTEGDVSSIFDECDTLKRGRVYFQAMEMSKGRFRF